MKGTLQFYLFLQSPPTIWIIGDLLSPCDKYRNEKNGLCRGPVAKYRPFFEFLYLYQGRNQAPIIYIVLFIVFLLVFHILNFSRI